MENVCVAAHAFVLSGRDSLNLRRRASRRAAARDARPFENLAEINKQLEQKKISLSEDDFSVGSRFFLVTSQTQFGKSTIRLEALLKRDGEGWPQLIWKKYR